MLTPRPTTVTRITPVFIVLILFITPTLKTTHNPPPNSPLATCYLQLATLKRAHQVQNPQSLRHQFPWCAPQNVNPHHHNPYPALSDLCCDMIYAILLKPSPRADLLRRTNTCSPKNLMREAVYCGRAAKNRSASCIPSVSCFDCCALCIFTSQYNCYRSPHHLVTPSPRPPVTLSPSHPHISIIASHDRRNASYGASFPHLSPSASINVGQCPRRYFLELIT